MIANVYDGKEGNGIDLEFDFENGMGFTIFLADEDAEFLIKIIENKLNARLKIDNETVD